MCVGDSHQKMHSNQIHELPGQLRHLGGRNLPAAFLRGRPAAVTFSSWILYTKHTLVTKRASPWAAQPSGQSERWDSPALPPSYKDIVPWKDPQWLYWTNGGESWQGSHENAFHEQCWHFSQPARECRPGSHWARWLHLHQVRILVPPLVCQDHRQPC